MKKRLFSFFLVIICVCAFSLSAFAKSIDDVTADDAAQITANPYLWYAQNQMLGVEKGTGVTLVCPNGDYKTLYTGGTLVTCPYDGEALVLADAGGVKAKKIPDGIGRKDLGYASDDGTPSVSSDGGIIWQPTWDDIDESSKNNLAIYISTTFYLYGFFKNDSFINNSPSQPYSLFYKKGVSDAIVSFAPNSSASSTWSFGIDGVGLGTLYFVAPIKGRYSLLASTAVYSSALDTSCDYGYSNYSSIYDAGVSLPSVSAFKRSSISVRVRNCYWHIWLPKYKIIPYNSADKPSSQTNITINNNTWNGNIYVDNSTNLTYIYPEYTTINENNETVTNISNNPIIYNSETKQYYTYDTVTNNYYYITYEAPATPTPSPSPSPSPTPTETPSPSESPAPTPTPDPGENPTPTPTPGGGIIITPGGDGSGSGSGSSSGITGGDDEGLFGWLWDLLKDLVKAILKAIFKVLSGLLGFLIWLVERVGILLPFLPAPAIAALGAGVVLVFVIRIIRFIRG